MDFEKELLRAHSKAQAHRIAIFVGKNRQRMANLIDVYLRGPYRITQRAAWPLSIIGEKHPDMIKPHLGKLIRFLKKPDIHDAVKRNTLRMLQFTDIPSKLQGTVADLCFQYLQDGSEAIAIRVFSMTVLASIARDNPEMSNEVRIAIEDQIPYGSAAFLSRAKKTLKAIQ